MMAMDLLRLEGEWTLQMGGRWCTLSNACSSQRCAFFFLVFLVHYQGQKDCSRSKVWSGGHYTLWRRGSIQMWQWVDIWINFEMGYMLGGGVSQLCLSV